MHVFIAQICDTAYIKDLEDSELTALCDHIDDAIKTDKDAVVRLWWTKKKSRARNASLLLITKYWVTPMGIRKLRIQCHRVNGDGRIGSRQILEERHQGRIVR